MFQERLRSIDLKKLTLAESSGMYLNFLFHIHRGRDNYSKQRPDIAKLFTHPWSVNIGKTAIFAFKLLSFYQEWSDHHKFCNKSKRQTSTLI